MSASLGAADLLDVYKRALDNDNQIKITEADYFIAKEQYNQSLSTVFPEIDLDAQKQENNKRWVNPPAHGRLLAITDKLV